MTRLKTAYEDFRKATITYFESKDEAATFRHESCSKAFNNEVSKAISDTGKVPVLATKMLWYQRYNGFHAKGLAKIIRDHQS